MTNIKKITTPLIEFKCASLTKIELDLEKNKRHFLTFTGLSFQSVQKKKYLIKNFDVYVKSIYVSFYEN